MKTLLLLSVLMVSACGMQGDLYLPDEGPDNGAESARITMSAEISRKKAMQKV